MSAPCRLAKAEKSLLTATEKSIEHWERMIAWVKTQPPNKAVSKADMLVELGEAPSADFCALCCSIQSCDDCPISIHDVACDYYNLGGNGDPDNHNHKSAWDRVYEAHTWAEWLAQARRMLLLLIEIKIKLEYQQEGE